MKRIGFTSGSFDPVTNGHLDVIQRAARMVDSLVIGIGVHPGKTPLFSTQEKIEMLKAETAAVAKDTGCRIEIVTFDNLTVDAAKAAGADPDLPRPARRHRLRLRDADGRHERRDGARHRHGVPARQPRRAPHHRHAWCGRSPMMGGNVSEFVSPAVARRLKAKAAKKKA